MPIEYEMKYLKETIEEAITKYSENTFSADWFSNIEYQVLQMVQDDSQNVQSHFRDFQISAMKELIKRGYWVKYSGDNPEYQTKTVLYRLTKNKEGAD